MSTGKTLPSVLRQASQAALLVKNPPANAGDIRDVGLIPGLGRFPGGGHGNPLQYSCLGNPMNREAWWATVHKVIQSQIRLKRLSTHASSPQAEMREGVMGGAFRPRVPAPGLTFTLIALLPHGGPPAPLIVPRTTAITRLPTGIVLALTPKPGHTTKQITEKSFFLIEDQLLPREKLSHHGHLWYHCVTMRTKHFAYVISNPSILLINSILQVVTLRSRDI